MNGTTAPGAIAAGKPAKPARPAEPGGFEAALHRAAEVAAAKRAAAAKPAGAPQRAATLLPAGGQAAALPAAAQAGPAQRPAPPPTPRVAADTGAFRHMIARLESGGPARPDQGYGARNPSSGALGRYQMLPVALRDIGWQDAAGGWTAAAARHGVTSEEGFLATPAAQEAAMSAFLRRAEAQLERNGSLARTGAVVPGLDGAAVPLTDAGLVAAAHRAGAHSVSRYLAHVGRGGEAPVAAADRTTFAAVERRLRQFADMPYQVAARRGAPSA